MQADFTINHSGSLTLLTPTNPNACLWLIQNAQIQSWQWTPGGSVALDFRCADAVLGALQADGLHAA